VDKVISNRLHLCGLFSKHMYYLAVRFQCWSFWGQSQLLLSFTNKGEHFYLYAHTFVDSAKADTRLPVNQFFWYNTHNWVNT
jgi:hypothetical protein